MKVFFVSMMFALGIGSVAHANPWYGDALYYRCNPDVEGAVVRGEFANGYEHYVLHGLSEGRITDGNCDIGPRPPNPPPGFRPPSWWNETKYLRCNPDVRQAVRAGTFRTGYQHYVLHGRGENRPLKCR